MNTPRTDKVMAMAVGPLREKALARLARELEKELSKWKDEIPMRLQTGIKQPMSSYGTT